MAHNWVTSHRVLSLSLSLTHAYSLSTTHQTERHSLLTRNSWVNRAQIRHITQIQSLSHTDLSLSHATRLNASRHTYEWVMSHPWISHVTHIDESCHAHGCVMDASKLQVSFAEYRLFCRALLQKKPIFLRSLQFIHIWMSHATDMNESCYTQVDGAT